MANPDETPFYSDLALVTGASTPMGLNIVHELAKEGAYDFLLHDTTPDQVERTRRSLQAAQPGLSVTTLSGDVLAPTFPGRLFDALGGRRIQVLVHVAGSSSSDGGSGSGITPNDDDNNAQQNHNHHHHHHHDASETTFLAAKKIVETLQPRMEDGGVVILIASLGGAFIKNALVDLGARRRIKGAWSPTMWLLGRSPLTSQAVSERCLQLYVRQKAPELAALGVRIVSVSPGLVEQQQAAAAFGAPATTTTNITTSATQEEGQEEEEGPAATTLLSPRSTNTADPAFATFLDQAPMHRLGRPDEVSAVVSFLASPRASYITGTDIAVDGGLAGQRWKATRRTASVVVNDRVGKMQARNVERTRSVHTQVRRRMSTLRKRPNDNKNDDDKNKRNEEKNDNTTATTTATTISGGGGEGGGAELAKHDSVTSPDVPEHPAVARTEDRAAAATDALAETRSQVEGVTESSQTPKPPRAGIARRYSVPSLRSTWGSVRGKIDRMQQHEARGGGNTSTTGTQQQQQQKQHQQSLHDSGVIMTTTTTTLSNKEVKTHDSIDLKAALDNFRHKLSESTHQHHHDEQPRATEGGDKEAKVVSSAQPDGGDGLTRTTTATTTATQKTGNHGEKKAHYGGQSLKSAMGSIRGRFSRFQEKETPHSKPMEISSPLALQTKPMVAATPSE